MFALQEQVSMITILSKSNKSVVQLTVWLQHSISGTSFCRDLNPLAWMCSLIPESQTARTAYWPLNSCSTCAFWHLHILHLFKSENKNAIFSSGVNGQMWLVDCNDNIYVIHWLWRPVSTGIPTFFLHLHDLIERGGVGEINRLKCKNKMKNCNVCFSTLSVCNKQ